MTTSTKWVLAGAILALAGWFYASPYLAFQRMHAAAERNDAAALSGQVDFSALRASIKGEFGARVQQELAAQGGNPYAAFGVAVAQSLIEKLVDAMVTPEGVAAMMQGRAGPAPSSRDRGARAGQPPRPPERKPNVAMRWESLDRFAVRVAPADAPGREVGLVLVRRGLSWKLAAVRLPRV